MMKDQRPYLVRAFYDWIVDSGCTPYLQIHKDYPGVIAPDGFDDEGILVLNISANATQGLRLGYQSIDFEARFRGVPMSIHVPMAAVLAIFAKETAQGMHFPMADSAQMAEAQTQLQAASQQTAPAKKETTKRDRSHLTVVK